MINKRIKRVLMAVVVITLTIVGSTKGEVKSAQYLSISASSYSISQGGSVNVYVSPNVVGTVFVNVTNGYANVSSYWTEGGSSFVATSNGAGTMSVTVSIKDGTIQGNYNLVINESSAISINVTGGGNTDGGNTGGGNTGGGNTGGGNTGGGNTGGGSQPGTSTPGASGDKTAQNASETGEKKDGSPDKKDSNTRLKTLTVDKGNLSPEFSTDVKKYNLLLPKDVTEVAVNAEAEAPSSKVEVSGNKDLKIGSNLIFVKVTAEDESFAHYEISAIVDEEPSIFLPFGSEKLGVVVNAGDIVIQEGYEETAIQINGKEVKSYKNSFNGKTILYLSNAKGDRAFYLYDVDKKEVIGKTTFMSVVGKNFANIELPDNKLERESMVYSDVEIDKNVVKGWKYEDEELKDFVQAYMMNETGNLNYYQYETTEGSFQIFHNTESVVVQKNSDILMYGLICLSIMTVAGIGASVYLWTRNRKISKVLFKRNTREINTENVLSDEKED